MKNFFKYCIVSILTFEAKLLLHRHQPTIIAITGSVGKTSTKDAIYSVLKGSVKARKSQKSFNSEIGVPLSVLGLQNAWSNPFSWVRNIFDGLIVALFSKNYPAVLVLETGVDRPGDMKRLTEWLKPDIVVLTRLPDVPAHVEYFNSPDEVIAEKMELVKALKPNGVLVYNHDDQKICEVIESVRQQSIGYSRYAPSQFTASQDEVLYEGTKPVGLQFTLTHIDHSVVMQVSESLGVQHAYNYAAAVAVASLFDISLTDAATSLSTHLPPNGRMRLIAGIKNTIIIDDTYNSSPVALERAIQTLHELKYAKRKIAVLGDMLELGQYSVREHERIGEQVASVANILITLGPRARKIAEGALEHGMDEATIFQYDQLERATTELKTMLTPGDVVLVKASQGLRAECLVSGIMADFDLAQNVLVRQDTSWKAR